VFGQNITDILGIRGNRCFFMIRETNKGPGTTREFTVALNKTWTRIGMGKVALANSLVGRLHFTPEEVALLISAVIPSQ
jgi:hypothetical protein